MKQGWLIRSLDDVTETILNGNSINAKVKKDRYSNLIDGTPYIATKDVGLDLIIDYDNGIKIPTVDIDSFKIAKKGSVLICSEGGSAGRKIGLINQDVCFGNKLFSLTPSEEIVSKYLLYWCQSKRFKEEFEFRRTGLIGGVSKAKFKTIPIPLPPNTEEQISISNKIDNYLAISNQIQLNIQKKLINIENIFQSSIDKLFGLNAVSESDYDWESFELQDILESQPRNGWSPSSTFDSQEGVPVLRLSAVTGFDFNSSEVKYTSAPVDSSAHYWIEENDLLVTRSNTIDLVGHIAICKNIITPTIYSDLIMRMRVNPCIVFTEFIYFQMRSSETRKLIKQSARGASATMQKIKKSSLQKIPICIPKSKNIQKKILNNFAAKNKEISLISENYYNQLNLIAEFKESILEKAFKGEL